MTSRKIARIRLGWVRPGRSPSWPVVCAVGLVAVSVLAWEKVLAPAKAASLGLASRSAQGKNSTRFARAPRKRKRSPLL